MSELGRRAATLAEHPVMAPPPVVRVQDRARRYRNRRLRQGLGACLAVALVAGGAGWRLADALSPFPQAGTFQATAVSAVPHERTGGHANPGTWRLTGYLTQPPGWNRTSAGPPAGGFLSCPQAGTCYLAGAGTGGNDLYVSRDGGLTWTGILVPGNVSFTSSLVCPAPGTCLAGGRISGHPVLLRTSDDGYRWSYRALPPADGEISTLFCPTAATCRALAAASSSNSAVPPQAFWFLATSDTGAHWSKHEFPATESISSLACWTATDCVAGGHATTGSSATSASPGVALRTGDGGTTWTPGKVPARLSLESDIGPGTMTCGRTGTCYAVGLYSQPTSAHAVTQKLPNGTTISTGVQVCPHGPTKPCQPSRYTLVGAVAVSTDGGATWRMLSLPPHTPLPALTTISCPTALDCWIGGTEAIPQTVPSGGPNGGSAFNGGSAMILGTTDGGITWTKTTFAADALAPGQQADSLMLVGLIACPAVNSCVGIGAADQGAAHTPVYTNAGQG